MKQIEGLLSFILAIGQKQVTEIVYFNINNEFYFT